MACGLYYVAEQNDMLNKHLNKHLGGSYHSDKRLLVLLSDCKRGAELDQDSNSSSVWLHFNFFTCKMG